LALFYDSANRLAESGVVASAAVRA
jgi:hypothetical protein